VPVFGYGFDQLKARIGALMGDPVECAYPDLQTGDLIQRTTTGLATHPARANNLTADLTTFTDGWRHWMMTPDGAIYWEGDSPEPTGGSCAWLPDATEPTAWTLPPFKPMWTVIVGSFRSWEEANRAAVRLCATALDGATLWSGDYPSLNPGYWVAYSGYFRDRDGAAQRADFLHARGFDGAYPRWVSH
jgi:hypothetical protein